MKIYSILWLVYPLTSALINPILLGWNPDPTILRVGDDYFIATSTFEYFPGHPIYHSKDLVSWVLIGHALTRPSQLTLLGTPSDAGSRIPLTSQTPDRPNSGFETQVFGLLAYDTTKGFSIWLLRPDTLTHVGVSCELCIDTYKLVFPAELRLFPRSFYVRTPDIFSNNWSDPIYFDSLGYDADLFWDTDGDVYTTWSGIHNAADKIYGIWQNKIDLATGTSLTDAQLIFKGTLPNNSSARPEGPHIYLVNGIYYLLIAEGGTDVHHRATIQRGPSPSGPWENNPKNPILFNGDDLTNAVQNTGHADIVEAPDGRWWGVALGVRPQNNNFSHIQLGRETFLFPVTWEENWPVFNYGRPIEEVMEGVLLDHMPIARYIDSFTSHTLDPSLYFLRTPYKPFHSLTARPGHLRLFANSYAVGDRDNPALLLRKQTSYSESFETRLEFRPTSNLTEAGITVFYGDFLHNEIGVIGNSSARWIIMRTVARAEQVGAWALTTANATTITTNFVPLKTTTDPVRLKVIALPNSYSLGFAEGADTAFQFPVSFDAAALSLPPAGGFFFKGASFGVYNTGNGRPGISPADFAYWHQIAAPGPNTNSSAEV